MTKIRRYACPGTSNHPPHEFEYCHHPSVEADPVPRFCPRCGYDSEGEEPTQALTTPHLGKSIRGVVDTMHRQMEEGAEFRAAMAQEKFGLGPDEARIMLETNSRDGLRQGDTSEPKLESTPVTQVMAAAPQGMFGFQGGGGVGYSGAVADGPYPNAGARTQAEVRNIHAKFTAQSGMAGIAASSMPALETQHPLYRVRVR